jgi:hypothetical protein
MKKIAAAALLLVVGTAPAFAWKPNLNFLHRHQNGPSHPQAIHPQNPHLSHPVRHKPHPVEQHHS